MTGGYSVENIQCLDYDYEANCILVDNCQVVNIVKNWQVELSYALSQKNDGYSIGVWKLKI